MAAADGDGNTALILAARCGHEAVAKLLLDHGADVAAADNHGNTAWIFAVGRGKGAVAKLLLVHGADVASAQNAGVTALIGATKQWQSCCWTIVQTWQLLTAMVTLH